MGYSAVPIQVSATAMLEHRYKFTQFRVNRPTVIALIVVLTKNLPIRLNLIANAMADAQVSKRITLELCDGGINLRQKIGGLFRGKMQKNKSAPGGYTDRVEVEITLD